LRRSYSAAAARVFVGATQVAIGGVPVRVVLPPLPCLYRGCNRDSRRSHGTASAGFCIAVDRDLRRSYGTASARIFVSRPIATCVAPTVP